jgi:hypothetical protein
MGGGTHPLIISSETPNSSILPIQTAPRLQFSLVPCIMTTNAYNPISNPIEGLLEPMHTTLLYSCTLVLCSCATKENKP